MNALRIALGRARRARVLWRYRNHQWFPTSSAGHQYFDRPAHPEVEAFDRISRHVMESNVRTRLRQRGEWPEGLDSYLFCRDRVIFAPDRDLRPPAPQDSNAEGER